MKAKTHDAREIKRTSARDTAEKTTRATEDTAGVVSASKTATVVDAVSTPFVETRRTRIMSLLEKEGSIQVNRLAQLFGVSRVTVRNDLDALARDGRLRRTHGGALALTQTITVSLQDQRINVNVEAKRTIAHTAAQLVQDDSAILVDSGTTALEFVKALHKNKGITLITNDFSIADLVDRSMPHIDVIVLGGMLSKGHRYTTGLLAMRTLESLHPDMAFICPTAFSAQRGLMTSNLAMAELKTAFMSCAKTTCILMDSSKVGATGLIRFGSPSDAHIIVSETDPEGQIAQSLAGSDTRLILAKN